MSHRATDSAPAISDRHERITLNPATLTAIARSRNWLHTQGVLRGTINVRDMASGLGVDQHTIARVYEGGSASAFVLAKLIAAGGTLDTLVVGLRNPAA